MNGVDQQSFILGKVETMALQPNREQAIGVQLWPSSRPEKTAFVADTVTSEEHTSWRLEQRIRGAVLCRIFDVVASGIAIISAMPLFILISLAILLKTGGPILFVHHRVGRNGKLFPCLKFCSMVVNSRQVLQTLLAESEDARREWARDQKLRNDPRVTALGRMLRRTSLDELPQLLNVFIGQMSIVGPRPITQAEIVRYGPRFTAYCSVRPGLTGLWQVSGRNDVPYNTRVRLDAFYAKRKSLGYDLMICIRTARAIISSRGCF